MSNSAVTNCRNKSIYMGDGVYLLQIELQIDYLWILNGVLLYWNDRSDDMTNIPLIAQRLIKTDMKHSRVHVLKTVIVAASIFVIKFATCLVVDKWSGIIIISF